MTRRSKREIEREIATLDADVPDGPGVNVVVARFSTDIPERFTVTVEPPEEDPIDRHTKVAIPKHLPPAYRGGTTVLDGEALRRLWDEMPDDVRKREREYRREHDELIPPVLAKDRTEYAVAKKQSEG
jgi:hypothetical protein